MKKVLPKNIKKCKHCHNYHPNKTCQEYHEEVRHNTS